LEPTLRIRENLPGPEDLLIDAEIWMHDSNELHDLAETIVNRQERFAWMVVDAWLTKHGQLLIDKE